ncbi:hypothetical protein V6Z05_00240 [Leptospira venezuelensis]|uniref:hypothetical protein n=1 Tax=Leptospira venezuelensis TaxID=1958811 RepID=UPI000A36C231|nr:hypothetical protein [Leptospira venezuelensis]
MFKIFKIHFSLLLIFTFALISCGEEKKNDQSLLSIALLQSDSGVIIEGLAEPNLGTAVLVLNSDSFDLLNQEECTDGGIGIIISRNAGPITPILNIHEVDMSKNFGIFLEAGALTTGSHMDLDHSDGKTYGIVNDCPAYVMENTPTIYDLQVLNCQIADQFGAGANKKMMSFRARCTKS